MELQRWVSSFAVEERPAAAGKETFGMYGRNGTVQTLALTGEGQEADSAGAKRCDFWFGEIYK